MNRARPASKAGFQNDWPLEPRHFFGRIPWGLQQRVGRGTASAPAMSPEIDHGVDRREHNQHRETNRLVIQEQKRTQPRDCHGNHGVRGGFLLKGSCARFKMPRMSRWGMAEWFGSPLVGP